MKIKSLVDPLRIWVFGFSNGGLMGYRLVCETSDLVTGVGVGACAFMVQGCFPGNSVILFQITGDQDIKVPLSGGGSYSVVSAEMSVSQFARANLCISVKEFRPDIDWEFPNGSAGKLVIGTN